MSAPEPSVNGHVDLDLDKERTFRLRGEVFRVNHVNLNEYAKAVAALDAAEAAGDSFESIWNAQADFLEASIHPDDLERFKVIRYRTDESLEPSDVRTLYTWLWGLHTGRPTQSAGASTPGPESSDPSSKAASGSLGVVRPS